MVKSKWARIIYTILQIAFEIVILPFKILFSIVELIDALKSKA